MRPVLTGGLKINPPPHPDAIRMGGRIVPDFPGLSAGIFLSVCLGRQVVFFDVRTEDQSASAI